MKALAICAALLCSLQAANAVPLDTDPIILQADVTECFKESDFPGHADVDPKLVAQYASAFINNIRNNGNYPKDQLYTSGKGIHYHFIAKPADGCRTDYLYAADIITAMYHHCINGGVGGKVQFDCVEYTFIGAE